jgi:hypothetical protein
MATRGCSHVTNKKGFRYHIDPKIMITIYNTRFAKRNARAAELHVINFDKLCDKIMAPNIDLGVLRVNLFPTLIDWIS